MRQQHKNNEAVQLNAAAALLNMTAGNNTNKLQCGLSGVRILLEALHTRASNVSVLEMTLGALASILPAFLLLDTDVVTSVGGVLDGAGVMQIVSVMRLHFGNASVIKRGLAVLLSVCKHDFVECKVMYFSLCADKMLSCCACLRCLYALSPQFLPNK